MICKERGSNIIMNSRTVILTLVISVIVALLTLCLSKPERKKLALVTGLLILLMGVLQVYIVINELGIRREVELYVFEELTRETDRYFDVLSYAIVYGTDGWLPKSAEEEAEQRGSDTKITIKPWQVLISLQHCTPGSRGVTSFLQLILKIQRRHPYFCISPGSEASFGELIVLDVAHHLARSTALRAGFRLGGPVIDYCFPSCVPLRQAQIRTSVPNSVTSTTEHIGRDRRMREFLKDAGFGI